MGLLKTWSPTKKLKLKLLTLKLVILCLLVTGQRCQSVHLINIRHMIEGTLPYIYIIGRLKVVLIVKTVTEVLKLLPLNYYIYG